MSDQEKNNPPQYRIVKDAAIENYFAYDVDQDEDGFWYDDDDNLLGAVVNFRTYPDHETLTDIFDDLLVRSVKHTQQIGESEAQELIDGCEDEDDFDDELDLSTTFSLLFFVEGHSGMYRVLLDCNDHWVGHSSGLRRDRFDI